MLTAAVTVTLALWLGDAALDVIGYRADARRVSN